MRLEVDKKGTETYTMQYRNMASGLQIRTDSAHGFPHIDVEWHDVQHIAPNKKKIQSKTRLAAVPENFEAAINLILINAEQYNPMIGAKYWLMAISPDDELAYALEQNRQSTGIQSSLTHVARAVEAQITNECIRKNAELSVKEALNVCSSMCEKILQAEKAEGHTVEPKISYVQNFIPLLLPVFAPPGSHTIFREYPRTGKDNPEVMLGYGFKF